MRRIEVTRIGRPQVRQARQIMREGGSLHSAAAALNVLSGDLDRAIWACIGIPDEDLNPYLRHQPPPMF